MNRTKLLATILIIATTISFQAWAGSVTPIHVTENATVVVNSETLEEYRSTNLSYNVIIPNGMAPADEYIIKIISKNKGILYQAKSANNIVTPSTNTLGPILISKNHTLIDRNKKDYLMISIPAFQPKENYFEEATLKVIGLSGEVVHQAELAIQNKANNDPKIRSRLSNNGRWIYVVSDKGKPKRELSAVVTCSGLNKNKTRYFYTFDATLKAANPDNCLDLTIYVIVKDGVTPGPFTEISLRNPFDYRLDSPRAGLSATLRRKLPLYYTQAWQHEDITSALPDIPFLQGDEETRYP